VAGYRAQSVTEAQLPSIKTALGELGDRLTGAGAEFGEVGFASHNTPHALLTFYGYERRTIIKNFTVL
jgi:hypothetical protein